MNTSNTTNTKANTKVSSPRGAWGLLLPAIVGIALLATKGSALANIPTVPVDFSTTGTWLGAAFGNSRLLGAGNRTAFPGAFEINITRVGNSTGLNLGSYVTFCTELAQPLGGNTAFVNNFVADQIEFSMSATAGQAGTASSDISPGGIGLNAAGQVRYLFDNHYVSTSITAWTNVRSWAFQLALWEITHDLRQTPATDFSLGQGNFTIGAQSGANSTLRNDAITLAQTYLTEIDNLNIGASYQSQRVSVWALTSPTHQDILLASFIGSPDEQFLTPLLPIPEPGAFPLVAAGLVVAVFMARRRRLAQAALGEPSRSST